ncbi:MAG: thiamine pyrophosphate-dependent enzyme [Planctomycetota bacterium]
MRKFNLNRAQIVDENFAEFIRSLTTTDGEDGTSARAEARGSGAANSDTVIDADSGLTGHDLIELFESQIVTRHQDLESRAMRARNEGFYTIGSSGHEGNAVVGRLTRHTDMAFLHYRSAAFMAERARKVPGIDITRDTMLSFAAGSEDPIAAGRHKVLGSVPLWVPPQTSTIASHLPKAVGAALSLSRARRLGVEIGLPPDSIIVCSFGDASVSHAVAQTALNAAARAAYQHLPVPILFVCEDNGIGISVETPAGWIEAAYSNRHGLRFYQADGLDLIDAHRVTKQAVDYCREHRAPVFLHLKTVRLLGHAGSDPETEYHSFEQIEAAEAKDPLLASAMIVTQLGLMVPTQVLDLYERIRVKVRGAAAYAARTPKLASAEEIMTPLAPYNPDAVATEAARKPDPQQRIRIFGGEDKLPEKGPPRHMAVNINLGLHDLLIKYPEAILFGEDVAKKGGVYHVTNDLFARFGVGRVFNTLLDETTILGLAIGAAHVGLLPIPEIQYLAYYHNAEDQIRGEACSLQYFSNGQYRNPMVIRIAGWAYQKGFGGHFHNDNSIAALRDVPGLVIATPARGDDAVKMMRTCMALAKTDGRVVAFIEPIALYMTKDLHEPKDALWSFSYPPPGAFIPLGEGAVYRSGVLQSEPGAQATGQSEPEAAAMWRAAPESLGQSEPGASATGSPPPLKRGDTGGSPSVPRVTATGSPPPFPRGDKGGSSSVPRVITNGPSEPRARATGDRSHRRGLKSPNRPITQSPNTTARDDLTILTFANGLHMSLRAEKTLREQHSVNVRVVDLRWLNPLNETFIIEQSLATENVLVVDEGRRTGGVAEAVLALLCEHCGSQVRAARLNARDTYIPLGPAADYVLPREADIVQACHAILERRPTE